MCGHSVGIRQKAHILTEGRNDRANTLMLCPSCHIIFDTRVKPKLYQALVKGGVQNLPTSWKTSIYDQAAEASMKATSRKRK